MSQLLQACLRNGKIFLPITGVLQDRGPQIDTIFWLGYDNNLLLIAGLFDENFFPLVWGIEASGAEPDEIAHFVPGTRVMKFNAGNGWERKLRDVQVMREAWTNHVALCTGLRFFIADNLLCRYYNHLLLSEYAMKIRDVQGVKWEKATPPRNPAKHADQWSPTIGYPVLESLKGVVHQQLGMSIAKRHSQLETGSIANDRNAYIARVADQVGLSTDQVSNWLNEYGKWI